MAKGWHGDSAGHARAAKKRRSLNHGKGYGTSRAQKAILTRHFSRKNGVFKTMDLQEKLKSSKSKVRAKLRKRKK